jgi:hypothetical protein
MQTHILSVIVSPCHFGKMEERLKGSATVAGCGSALVMGMADGAVLL